MAKDPDFTLLEREISGVLYMSTAGEDFSEFAEKVPSAFYFVGAGNKEKKSCYPHHNPRFNIDEDAMSIGVEMQVRSALEFFNKE